MRWFTLRIISAGLRLLPVAMGKRARTDPSHPESEKLLRLSASGINANQISKIEPISAKCETRAVREGTSDATTKQKTLSTVDGFFNKLRRSVDIELHDGSRWNFQYADPSALLSAVLQHNDAVYEVFMTAWRKWPSSQARPWGVLYGADECWSGNPLHQSGRKSFILSYSFVPFGALSKRYLAKSACWFTVGIVRALQIKQVPGEFSRLFGIILRDHFLSSTGSLMNGGVLLMFRGHCFLLWGEFANLLADGDGWRQILQCKGGSAIKLCPLCTNVVSVEALARLGSNLVSLSCCEPRRFSIHSKASLSKLIRLLFQAEADWLTKLSTKKAYQDAVKAAGYEPDLHGIWGDRAVADVVSPSETLTLDWVHICLSDGFFPHELALYINSCDDASDANFESFCALSWEAPGITSPNLGRAFVNLRQVLAEGSLSGHTRPSCTEMLQFASVVNFWVASHADTCGRRSLLACIRVIATVQQAKFLSYRNDAEIESKAIELADAHKGYITETIKANGTGSLISKHHWFWHIPLQFVRDKGQIYDCFIVERLHRRVKKLSWQIVCTSSFEKSCLARVSLAHCFDGDIHDRTELTGRYPITPSAEAIRAISPLHITASKRMAVLDGWLQLHIGDFVKCDNHYCRILDLVAVAPNDDVRIFASVCTVVNSTGVMWNILGVSHATMVFDPATSEDIHLALAWRELSAEKFVVLWLFQRSHHKEHTALEQCV